VPSAIPQLRAICRCPSPNSNHGFEMRRSNPAVTAAIDGLNEDRIVSRISQGVSKAFDRAANSEIKINEHVAGPQSLTKLFARDDFVWTAQQELQCAKG
jgi:hypothetical protein